MAAFAIRNRTSHSARGAELKVDKMLGVASGDDVSLRARGRIEGCPTGPSKQRASSLTPYKGPN